MAQNTTTKKEYKQFVNVFYDPSAFAEKGKKPNVTVSVTGEGVLAKLKFKKGSGTEEFIAQQVAEFVEDKLKDKYAKVKAVYFNYTIKKYSLKTTPPKSGEQDENGVFVYD